MTKWHTSNNYASNQVVKRHIIMASFPYRLEIITGSYKLLFVFYDPILLDLVEKGPVADFKYLGCMGMVSFGLS